MGSNKDKIILDLCGGTGAWSRPYLENGYTVKVITHPHFDVFEYDEYKQFIDNVYGVLAAPTCTMFSLARTTASTPRDLRGGFSLVQRCLDIIHDCRFDGALKFWALENPTGLLRQVLGKPYLTFNPNDYGDSYTKKTDLWGYFNLPKVKHRPLTEDEAFRCSINNRELPTLPDGYTLPKGFGPQAARRSMTSPFFAEAFYKANK